jgi:hypothetical protein
MLAAMPAIDLPGMARVDLQDRRDSKYALSVEQLPELLERITPHYRILDPGHGVLVPYNNRYFDTPSFRLFLDHHNGRVNRYKFRFRRYGDSGITYFEVKHKTNKGRTQKTRVLAPPAPAPLPLELGGPASREALAGTPFQASDLVHALDVSFSRFTLVHHGFKDRCTVDTGLAFSRGPASSAWPSVVICEVKQQRFSRDSPFVQALEAMGIRPLRISKYCLGILDTVPGIKYNRFKEKLRRLHQLSIPHHA